LYKAQSARGLWLLITLISILFYLVTAWAYYHVLRSDPFLGSTVQPAVTNVASVQSGLARWGLSLDLYALILVAEQAVITAASCILGGLIFWRRQSDPVAWWMGLILVLMGTQIPVQAIALGQLFPVWGFLGFTTNQIGTAANLVLIWTFPNGRFVPYWSRWTFAVTVALGAYGTLYPDTVLTQILIPSALILISSGVLAQVYRYLRVSGPIERQQTKLVLLALTIAPATWAISSLLLPAIFPMLTQNSQNAASYNLLRLTLGNFANLLIPLTIGLSILRYRLFDIDVIIRKTLQYGVLSALLALVYFGSVVLLQTLFGPVMGDSPLLLVLSTLLIAAVFNPLRRRVQDLIDRSFYRKKYDAAQVLARFAQTAQEEVEMEKLLAALVGVVQETIQPDQVGVWLKESGKVKRDA
jgi:hypothetical protein